MHPPAAQPSATIPHEVHAPPAIPQAAAVVGSTQLEPEQQPLAHVVALQLAQMPAEHAPPVHALHAAPPVPHALVEVPARHVAPWQQPVHELGSHTHVPA